MMEEDNTISMDVIKTEDIDLKEILQAVHSSLEEKGYNATSQIVGYLLSGDLGYISSYQNARNKISTLDRAQVVEYLLEKYLK